MSCVWKTLTAPVRVGYAAVVVTSKVTRVCFGVYEYVATAVLHCLLALTARSAMAATSALTRWKLHSSARCPTVPAPPQSASVLAAPRAAPRSPSRSSSIRMASQQAACPSPPRAHRPSDASSDPVSSEVEEVIELLLLSQAGQQAEQGDSHSDWVDGAVVVRLRHQSAGDSEPRDVTPTGTTPLPNVTTTAPAQSTASASASDSAAAGCAPEPPPQRSCPLLPELPSPSPEAGSASSLRAALPLDSDRSVSNGSDRATSAHSDAVEAVCVVRRMAAPVAGPGFYLPSYFDLPEPELGPEDFAVCSVTRASSQPFAVPEDFNFGADGDHTKEDAACCGMAALAAPAVPAAPSSGPSMATADLRALFMGLGSDFGVSNDPASAAGAVQVVPEDFAVRSVARASSLPFAFPDDLNFGICSGGGEEDAKCCCMAAPAEPAAPAAPVASSTDELRAIVRRLGSGFGFSHGPASAAGAVQVADEACCFGAAPPAGVQAAAFGHWTSQLGGLFSPSPFQFTFIHEIPLQQSGLVLDRASLQRTSDKPLGSGTFGTVFKAKGRVKPAAQPGAWKEVVFALKVVRFDSARAIAAFNLEVEALTATLQLKGFVQLKGALTDLPHIDGVCTAGCAGILLQFADMGSLQDIRAQYPLGLPFDMMVFIMATLRVRLKALHLLGWLHRDIKPENMLVDDREGILISDMGLARRMDAAGTCSGIVGTPPCMAPEVIAGRPYGPAADCYAAGVSLMSLGTPEACQAFNDAFILGNPLPAIQAAQKVLDNIKDAADVNIVKGVNCQHPWQAHYLAEFIKELLHAEPTHRMTPDVMEGHEVFTDFDIVAFNSGAMKNPVKGP